VFLRYVRVRVCSSAMGERVEVCDSVRLSLLLLAAELRRRWWEPGRPMADSEVWEGWRAVLVFVGAASCRRGEVSPCGLGGGWAVRRALSAL